MLNGNGRDINFPSVLGIECNPTLVEIFLYSFYDEKRVKLSDGRVFRAMALEYDQARSSTDGITVKLVRAKVKPPHFPQRKICYVSSASLHCVSSLKKVDEMCTVYMIL